MTKKGQKKTRSELATAARAADDYVAQHGLRAWVEEVGQCELDALHYVAEQRALRSAALLIDGASPAAFTTGGFKLIHLSPLAQRMFAAMMATWMDGFAVGVEATR